MRKILYIQIDKNIKVECEEIYLRDIATLNCSDKSTYSKIGAVKLCNIPKEQYGRYPFTVSDILEKIQKADPEVEIVHIGEPDFILTYEDPSGKHKFLSKMKVVLVCLITFFGTAFSIMTFNKDVEIVDLFQDIYRTMLGRETDGITILEISYSIGIGLGAVFFFNHFGKRKITQDPTPMEVEMRTYEDAVDTTIIEQKERKRGN